MKAEILAGMDLLDEKVPGWERSVNLDRLDQYEATWTNDDCGCVLVQVFGSYDDGMEELRIFKHDAGEFGFVVGNDNITIGVTTSQDLHRHYQTLTAWWKRLFRARYGPWSTADASRPYGLEFRFAARGDGKMRTYWFASLEEARRFEESNVLNTVQYVRHHA